MIVLDKKIVPQQHNTWDCGIYCGINTMAVSEFYRKMEDDSCQCDTKEIVTTEDLPGLTFEPLYKKSRYYMDEFEFIRNFRHKYYLLLNFNKAVQVSTVSPIKTSHPLPSDYYLILRNNDNKHMYDEYFFNRMLQLDYLTNVEKNELEEQRAMRDMEGEQFDSKNYFDDPKIRHKLKGLHAEDEIDTSWIQSVTTKISSGDFKDEDLKEIKSIMSIDDILDAADDLTNLYNKLDNPALEHEKPTLPVTKEYNTFMMKERNDVGEDKTERANKTRELTSKYRAVEQIVMTSFMVRLHDEHNNLRKQLRDAKKRNDTDQKYELTRKMKTIEDRIARLNEIFYPVTNSYGYNNDAVAHQCSHLWWNTKQNSFYGLFGYHVDKSAREMKLEQEWVMENFKAEFLINVQLVSKKLGNAKRWILVPAGDSRFATQQDVPISVLELNFGLCYLKDLSIHYPQGEEKLCVPCSFASGMHLVGLRCLATAVYSRRFSMMNLDAETQVNTLYDISKDYATKNDIGKKFNMSMYRYDETTETLDLRNADIDPDTLLFVIPIGTDGGTAHAFCVWNSSENGLMIIDSNDEYPLAFSRRALDFCCGYPAGYHSVLFAIKFEIGNNKPTRKRKKGKDKRSAARLKRHRVSNISTKLKKKRKQKAMSKRFKKG